MSLELPEIGSITDIGVFTEDKLRQRYGFTIVLNNGKIQNIFINGDYSSQRNNIELLKEYYDVLIKQLKNRRSK